MTIYEKYRDEMNAQALKMLKTNLEWLENLEQPHQKETVDSGCKHQDIEKGI